MELDILIEDDRWAALDLASLATRAIEATLQDQNIQAAELSVLGCDDVRIKALNCDFRGKAAATNVLSWPEDDLAPDQDGDAPQVPRPDHTGTIGLGDIAIAYDTCAREAVQQNKPMTDHVTHLLVHGTLHLLGYDHIRDLDATRMEAIEVKILGSMGLPDPY
ncbi:rRNA maturation RNase YbeY [Tateyamaria pelophila]|uniref:rRNA maturation RNase YbeY n=1 Tax=Tateyamaria pelophila TaxID=328415 RepID=UPI001CBE7A1F|nr:rRNA maturation RNase YbeY [Tateyamaria pelophila]